MSNKNLGEMISSLRKEKNMTQNDLAKRMNVTDKAVSKWERNLSCPDINSIPKLAEILGIGERNLSKIECGVNFVSADTLEKLAIALDVSIKELFDLGKLNPSPIKGSDMHEALHSSNFKFDRKLYIEEIKKLTGNIKEKYSNGEIPFSKGMPRILITGCPTGGLVDKIIKQIEEAGASVVCFENCVGTKNFENLVDENKDPIEAIAERYIDIPCSVMSPNDKRMETIKQYIEEYAIDGVVDVTLSACHTYAVETEKVRKAVESTGKSYLSIETNYSNSDAGQLRTRLEAFVEML